MNENKTALYRHFDATGALLYVGISICAISRFAKHRLNAKWTSDSVRIEIEWFNSRNEAELAEIEAINKEKPRFNISNNLEIKPLQKANKIIRQSSPRRFIDFTKEEQRIVWACISLKNDFKEQKRIIWYGMPRGKEIQIDYKTNFLLSNVYFSKLFGTTFKDSSFHIKHGTALLSKDFNTVEIFNDIKFMIKKSGWIDKINHKITTVSTINTQENCSEHLFRIKFYDDVLESFQNSENENEPEYEDV